MRVDADAEHLELAPGVKFQNLHGTGESGEDLTAKHGAGVVHHGENYRLALIEILAQRHRTAIFVAEIEVEGDLAVEPLVDANTVENLRLVLVGRALRLAIELCLAERYQDRRRDQAAN